MRLPPVLLLLLLPLPLPLRAQVVRGRARDEGTDRPVAGVVVRLLDEVGTARVRVVSDSAGRFRLPAPEPGNWVLEVSDVAYGTQRTAVLQLAEGEVVEVVLPLRTQVIGLAPLNVVARRHASRGRLEEYYDRLEWYGALGVGRFVQRAELERMGGSRASDVLRNVARVRLQTRGLTTTLAFSDGCVPLIVLDGVRLQHRAQTDFDSFIPLRELEGVEIYRGAAETPPEYQDACGAILFWSRAHPADAPRFTWKRALGLGATVAVLLLLIR